MYASMSMQAGARGGQRALQSARTFLRAHTLSNPAPLFPQTKNRLHPGHVQVRQTAGRQEKGPGGCGYRRARARGRARAALRVVALARVVRGRAGGAWRGGARPAAAGAAAGQGGVAGAAAAASAG